MKRTLLFTTAALVLLTAPVQASWYCPAYGTYYPNVSICPNWIPDPYGPQERQADQAAAMAQRAAEERTAARLAAEAARQQAATDAAKVRAQVSAENSPNNLCRDPETAGMLNEFNGMDWSEPRKAIDIEHLVTISGEPLACHGIWVLTHGAPIEGTMSFRKNVADNTIVSFHPGTWQPPLSLTPSRPAVTPASSSSAAFADGARDREDLEAWYTGLTGDYKIGAGFWAGQRSLPHPQNCSVLVHAAEIAGCRDATVKLTPMDVRRKSEPDYRAGWNSVPSSG